jgi:cell division protein FtsW (lipid II flippase)
MRLAGVFILALLASAVAGVAAYAAMSFLPDWSDPAGRGPGGAFRFLLTGGYVILGIVLYGLVLWRRDRERRMKRMLYVLFLVPFLVVVLGLFDNGNGAHHINWLREGAGLVQMFVPLWTVALAQWLILHIFLSRQSTLAKAAST